MNKRIILLTIFSMLLLYNCTSTRELYIDYDNNILTRKINDALKYSDLTTNMGIKVVSLRSGKILYSLNSNHLFTPASNNKLYTASAALHYLSPQFKFKTSVWIDSSYIDSNHVPRLVLVGGGDPDLFLSELEVIAKEISENIESIDTLIINNTLFDDVYFGPGWMWDEGSDWYFAHVNAMTFNDNCVDITITPGAIGEKPIVSLNPGTKFVDIINEAVTVEDTIDSKELEIERRWEENNNVIDISGEVMKDANEEIHYINIENPALFTGTVLFDLLNQLSTEVKIGIFEGQKSSTMIPFYTYYSEPITNSLANFLETSDNLSGELYVKMIGHVISGQQGNWDNGMLAIKTFLNDKVKIDTTKMRMEDGSGLSRYNLTSPDQLTKLLKYMYSDFIYTSEFIAVLPSIGQEGTLKDRMQLIENKYSIRAKTGTLSGVSCLSGYAFIKSGEPLAFSIMMNGYVDESKPYQDLQDRICEILVGY
ncbi:MAG: D-alanyl-D-alanine carboxypeptidase/D-alanyl-D-alanine-endopeptidase [Planctomycetia bacterium]|nr:D-alanyl-D-alanine carboxypeptidase/D-alanyl-D-alanine-endopeptidase [Planctomycetia bacterium]